MDSRDTDNRNRGPLRALHWDQLTQMDSTQCSGALMTETCEKCLRCHLDEPIQTPFVRTRCTVRRRGRFPADGFSKPLYTSSLRASRNHWQHNNVSSTEDIRHHFPVRAVRIKGDSVNGSDAQQQRKKNIVGPESNHLKRRAAQISPVLPSKAKQSRGFCSVNPTEPHQVSQQPESMNLTMGSHVKTHPRYSRRHTRTDSTRLSECPRVCLKGRLSPICPVPMPTGFPAQLPAECEAVRVPWERTEHAVTKRTCETQTSPISALDCHPGSNAQSVRNRRRSGSAQVLCTLRKTFGTLRRAISADRLNKVPPTSNERSTDSWVGSQTCDTDNWNTSSSKRYGRARFSMSSQSSRRSDVSSSRTSTAVTSNVLEDIKNVSRPSSDSKHVIPSVICEQLGRFRDGSIKVTLRRSSTAEQFGIFIAQDAKGIYISRIGSVKCAVKFWDIMHVGDRILEVQGVSCSRLGVEDVQNLIRGCELAEFRIKPNTMTDNSG